MPFNLLLAWSLFAFLPRNFLEHPRTLAPDQFLTLSSEKSCRCHRRLAGAAIGPWASLDKVQPIVMLINGDREIGKIAQAMEKVGKEGVVTVSELERPLVLIHEKKISDVNTLVRILEIALQVLECTDLY
uniref:Uncharacterized protein n=1 Tax=Opuntia streptacantha TaxID=393608 RepID=A0A7C8ZTN9_OPUST